jgi:hypothetical protein
MELAGVIGAKLGKCFYPSEFAVAKQKKKLLK